MLTEPVYFVALAAFILLTIYNLWLAGKKNFTIGRIFKSMIPLSMTLSMISYIFEQPRLGSIFLLIAPLAVFAVLILMFTGRYD